MTTNSSQLPSIELISFARGVIAALDCWPVLRLAIQESWGGPDSVSKKRWIASSIVDAFEISPLDEEDVELLLLDALVEGFETEVDDGSSRTIACDIVRIWRDVSNNQMGFVLKLECDAQRLIPEKLQASRRAGNGDDEWEDADMDEDEDNGEDDGRDEVVMNDPQVPPPVLPQPRNFQRMIDEEGFELDLNYWPP
ncbi:Pre-rRNA-processing protein TSR2-domain-containing protein [Cantharellus anzutake]|uniref:Pre-rRNA-processing protein TSR2-domain-containing protein n=1 Tax=Cantharellus anzutake TaxID=1750568 RepID=UPI001907F993|nr:Pre-rRNA-processing protein TSR2-domain-containing protein [Cantharellus anzutake]KAF8335031.1 Pre-rRNA-processing protein TSR2-domain-containing protein [Cantharellus anzutake]